MSQSITPQEQQLRAALQQAAELVQKQKLALAAYHEPIAIVGMGCCYPGESDTPERFWQNLLAGFDGICTLPEQRIEDMYRATLAELLAQETARQQATPATAEQQAAYALRGGFLARVDQFDPAFFGLSPREVLVMDPTHRLLLETVWQALENANIVPETLFNTEVGVFVGGGMSGYLQFCGGQEHNLYLATGNTSSTAAGRISYVLGITGPCVAIDTACSSSLTAVHLACQSLRDGECSAALVGGVNLILEPGSTAMFAGGNMLSDEARCKTFDAAADGYVRGEGCGILVLKRLSDARSAGDHIIAVIRGTAVNQDGPSGGLTVPNGPAQERVIRRALADAKLKPEQIGYIEAHGTGTPLGDPIEIGALSAVFAGRNQPLYVGSVKTNVGHLEMAAGVAGLMKLALAVHHGAIPPHLHLHTPNPHIDWTAAPVQVPTTAQPWPQPAGSGERIGGVSSFGFSGTNAHVIISQAPALPTPPVNDVDRSAHLLTLSAKSAESLQAYLARYQAFLAAHPDLDLADLCYSSHVGRSHFTHRLSVTATSVPALQQQLHLAASGDSVTGVSQGVFTLRQATPKVAFLFTGQGSQYVDMGRTLYATNPTFRAALDRCEALYQAETGESLLAVMYPEATTVDERLSVVAQRSSLDDTTYTQPALFALEYALATLWQSWGVQPDVLIGHSVGEVAAACVAGVFSLENGMKLIAARGRLMGALPQDGTMIAVQLDEAQAQQLIAPYADRVAIAAVNGPNSLVLSGERDAIDAVVGRLLSVVATDASANPTSKIKHLTVSHAFHSPLMAPMLDAFRQVAQRITYHAPTIPLVSNVSGKLAGAEIMTADYWVRHVREAVRFADGLQTLQQQGITTFLEIGPQPVLLGMAELLVREQRTENRKQKTENGKRKTDDGHPLTPSLPHPVMVPSLRRNQADWQPLLTSLGELYVRGVAIDWGGLDRDYQRRKIVLPTYPFQRQRYWPERTGLPAEAPTAADGFATWLATHTIEQLTDLITERGHFVDSERAMVTKVLTLLEHEERTQRLTAQVESLLYTVAWETQPKPLSLTPPATPGQWLLLSDEQGIGGELAAGLQALGETVTIVTETTAVVAALKPLLAPASGLPLRGILHLGALHDDLVTAQTSSAHLMAQQEQNLSSVLQIVQTLAEAGGRGPMPRLWVITQGAQQLTPTERVAVAQTPLWGLGRVVALEHGELWGGLLDIDEATTAQTLLAEVLQARADGETQIAYRQGTRAVARLTRAALSGGGQVPVAIQTDATYLITGGLGALGLLVAEWLANQGANHLILTGRRGLTTDTQRSAIQQLTARGINVQIVQIDVADEAAMQQFFAQIAAGALPLKGVFHTAGVLDDAILLNQRWARFADVLAPKVSGGWLLHQLTAQVDLDFLVFFSSATALLGTMGQGNYAAANAFLDGLARYRQQQGLPGLSINWGAWADVGMAARTVQSALGTDQMITPAVGIAALARLLSQRTVGDNPHHVGQIAVLAVDWTRLGAGVQPFFAQLAPQHATTSTPPSLIAELTALPVNLRLDTLHSHLQRVVGTILGMSTLPDPATGFTELGMDSLMALEVRRRLEGDLGCSLPTTLAFEYPTVDELAAYLLSVIQVEDTQHATRNTQHETSLQSPVSDLTLHEPIAVISMACRFPGADTPEAFWQLLHDGVDTVGEVPATRWAVDAFYDPQRPQPGKMYTREAAFVANVAGFDPLFFGIAPREAVGIDPQHRLLLETSWEALERAGLAPDNLVDSQTGVFVGIGESDYGLLTHGMDSANSHAVTNSGHSIAAGRLAYTLGLQGPTLAVDTACSSSLVALHLACQSLRNGECDLALAGGVNLMLTPFTHIALSQMQALSPDGRCKTFDAAADGYGRGEGGAMVLLKRLSDADRDGDTVLAVIKGSAVNHDGHSSGLTVPNKRAQEKLLRQALANAQVSPDEVSYIEAHGTGTALGDPIELRALGAVFGAERATPLLVGSVKTNVGHLEAAAGIAGFLKTVLALHQGEIPPHLHFHTPTPHIAWEEMAIQVPTTLQPWPDAMRVAGISAFGLSGTNAHLIVAAAEERKRKTDNRKRTTENGQHETQDEGQRPEVARPLHLLPLSAKGAAALPALAQRYLTHLASHPELDVADFCYTAAVGRNHFSHRIALVAADQHDLQAKLVALAQAQPTQGVQHGSVTQRRPRVAFLFTGQGSQYIDMGRTLYATSPTFRTALDRCEALYQAATGESLLAVMYPETGDWRLETGDWSPVSSLLDDTTYTQPALFALEYALATLWQSWGIQPDVLIGHSVGEVAAACVAGVFSLADGMKLIAARGRLMGALPQDGTMVSLLADEAQVQTALAPYANTVSIAAVNGPQSVVISGQRAAVQQIVDQLAAQGVKSRPLTVSHAFHSPLMTPILDDFHQVAQTITYHVPTRPFISNVSGKLAGDEVTTPEYWVRHVREAVRFADGIATLQTQGIDILLEIGPQPILLGMAEPLVREQRTEDSHSLTPSPPHAVMLPSLRQHQPDWQPMLTSLGELYVQGVAIAWEGFDQDYHPSKVLLPTYPFQRQSYWPVPTDKPEDTAATDFAAWVATHDLGQLTDRIIARVTATTMGDAWTTDNRAVVAQVLAALAAEQHSQARTAQVTSLLYDVAWERQPAPLPLLPPATPGRWLILTDEQEIGAALATALTALGESIELVPAADSALLATALVPSADSPPLRGVLHLGGLHEGTAANLSAASASVSTLMARQERNLRSVLELVQTLASTRTRGAGPRLWIMTRGAQQLTALESVAVAQAPLWGLGRVIALEHAELWGGLLDIDEATLPSSLLPELLQVRHDGETQVAYRHGVRHVARLVRRQAPAQPRTDVTIQADALYLITGGLGALGLLVAEWLADQGARHLLLTGRRGVTSPGQQAALDRLASKGVTVQLAQVDVADETAMRALFAQLATVAQPLKGVVHTAGVLDDAILLNQQWSRFATVLASKVSGGWLLHELTQTISLDFMVFFSSAAALLGSLGQGNYAAANAFLDALARYRQQQGLPGLSINWGAWADVGMAARTVQGALADNHLITPDLGIATFAHLLTHSGQIGVLPIDWTALANTTSSRQPFLANLVPQAPVTPTQQAALVTALTDLPVNQRLGHLRAHVQQVVATVLGMTEPPARTTGFAELGMDSLMALELRRRLESDLATQLPTTLAFEYPTVDELAAYLLDVIQVQNTQHATRHTPHETSPQSPLSALSLHEPIAVISMACRFPGADTPEAFWQLLHDGIDTVGEVPATRWAVDDFYDPKRPQPGKMYMREAAFVEGVEEFDPLFFGIAPREAVGMDPQHRLLLETSWEALERAGLAPEKLVDSPTGVFVGIGASEYGVMSGLTALAGQEAHAATSSGHSIAAGRLAYTLGLQGPTLAVDTACSSSLVALHLACQSLRNGECDLALAGGVNLMLTPFTHIALSQMQALSPDGRCKTFDAAADGYGRGEGGAMVLLKRLSDADRDGDTVLAVIKGSAVNHDGHSSGLTVPNKRAQEKLLRQALANAQVTPDEVSYIEAHGTGTALGDPIELRALGAVFGAERATPLLVGSVKTNVGHLEAAAGIAGFLKTVLALHQGEIPPHLHFHTPTPHIEWEEMALQVPTTRQPWPVSSRVAGISAFGLSGTNAHLIVAAAEERKRKTENGKQKTENGRHATQDEERRTKDKGQRIDASRPLHLLPLSAKSAAALPALAQRYLTHLASHPELDVADFCYTAAVGRNHFSHRLALVAATGTEMADKLTAIAQGQETADLCRGVVFQQTPKVAFLFTGQGSQYVDMGRILYATNPTFRAALDHCEELYQAETGESLLAVLYPEETTDAPGRPPRPTIADERSSVVAQRSSLDDTTYTQPALFALEYALAILWQSWGVQPDLLIGHSIGEVAAACVAGVFSLEDGMKLIAARGRLMGALPQDGTMIAVQVDEAQAQQVIAPYADRVSIAAVNGPNSLVLSGERAAIDAVAGRLLSVVDADASANPTSKIKHLTVSHAFHSPLMTPMLDDFRQVAQTITYHAPTIPLVSNVSGKLAGAEIMTADYWVRHVREAVRFADGVQTLQDQGVDLWLEIGPQPTLLSMAESLVRGQWTENEKQKTENRKRKTEGNHPITPSSGHLVMLPSLRRRQSDWQRMLTSLGELYVQGVAIDWEGFARDDAPRKVLLPTYPFQRQRYWLEAPKRKPRLETLRPLIDKMIAAPALRATLFETAMSVDTLPFLDDHRVYTMVVAPGACHLAMVLSAAELAFAPALAAQTGYQVKEVVFPQPLALADEETRTAQIVLTAAGTQQDAAQAAFQLLSFAGAPGDAAFQQLTHALGRVGVINNHPSPLPLNGHALAALQERCTTVIPAAHEVDDGAGAPTAAPIVFGPAFRWIEEIWHAPLAPTSTQPPSVDLLAKLRCPTAIPSLDGYLVHPGLLDACFQVVGWGHQLAAQNADLHLPFAVDTLRLYPPAGTQTVDEWWCHVTQSGANKWDIRLFDNAGHLFVDIAGYEIRAAPQSAIQTTALRTDWLYALDWEAAPLVDAAHTGQQSVDCWVLWGDVPVGTPALVQQLGATGQPLFVVQRAGGQEKGTIATAYPDLAVHTLVVDATDAAAVRALLTEITTQYRRVGLVYLGIIEETLEEALVPTTALTLSSGLLHVVQALATMPADGQLWLVTQGCHVIDQDERTRTAVAQPFAVAAAGALWGLGRTIAQEQPQLRTICIDLDQTAPVAAQAAVLAAELQAGLNQGAGETQVAYHHQTRYVARLDRWQGLREPTTSVTTEQPVRLQLSDYGSLDNLTFVPLVRRPPAAGEVEVAVKAVGLNFRDVLNTLGMLRHYYAEVLGIRRAQDVALGFECAGVVTAVGEGVTTWAVGDRVMGIVNGGFASYVTATAATFAPVPASFTFAEAATIPLAFLTAWYGLCELAKLRAGERVLIHAAAGGVGQAALQIAQAVGADIWGTASPGKWAFLQQQGVAHVLNSRTLAFAEEIIQATAGAGVDVVLNSLSGDFVEQSFAALSAQGRFVEIGKLGIWTPAEANQRRPAAAYYPFDLGEVLAHEPALYPRLWTALLAGFADGTLRPLPHQVFPAHAAADAFRFMQQAKQIGKVVVSFEETGRTTLHADASYLITGGLGDLGVQIAQQLVADGAKHLILSSRRREISETTQATLAQLEAAGATVHLIQADIAERAEVQRLLAACTAVAPLRGIVHAAGVLDDGLLAQQSVARFDQVLRPKVAGAWHLHTLTADMALDFFICFSSASSLLGAAGQSNYAAANAFMDTLMQQRAAAGMPGLSLNWGPWAEIGMAARLAAQHQKRLATSGIGAITPQQGAHLFAALLAHAAKGGQVGIIPIRWEGATSAQATGFLARLVKVAPTPVAEQSAAALLTHLQNASAQECQRLFVTYLQETVTKILRLPTLPAPQQGLVDIGMDSLMAVELRSHVGNTFQISLAMTAFIDSSIEQLAVMLAEQWLLARLQQDGGQSRDRTAVAAAANPLEAQQQETDPEEVVIEEFVL